LSGYEQHYRTVQRIVDDMVNEPDPVKRLDALSRLHDETTTLLRRARNKAAYDLRVAATSRSAALALQRDRQTIDTWAHTHMRDKGLPPLTKERRPDFTGVRDLSGG